jgi:CRP/FNR family cyclic AMP-dependent transcriptional regulator
MLRIRPAREEDVGQIRDIFIAVYQNDYPYQGVYDALWLKRSVLSDDALVMVAEESDTGRIVGTASVLFDIGAHSDLVGEFGRLAVLPDFRRQHAASLLMGARLEAIKDRLHVGLIVGRTVHPYAQRISLTHEFVPAGFLPLRHVFHHRESFALLVRFFGDALALRCNNPRVIPEIYPLSQLVMHHARLRSDVIVDEDSPPYPAGADFAVEEMRTEGYSTLLRIERGRVRHREVFGPVRLEYGFFKLRAKHITYLVARDGAHVAGAVGYMHDPVEQTARVIELVASTDEVIRFLLAELERTCREEHGVQYIEIDVSAHAPRMQRTLLELDFLPAAYLPAMVFHEVERLDIVRMVRLISPQELGPLVLADPVREIADLVMRGFANRAVAPRMTRAIAEVPLFAGMSTEQALRLAGTCRVVEFEEGARIYTASDPTDCLYLILDGQVQVSTGSPPSPIATLRTGETLGEISLLAQTPRAATATAITRVEAAAIPHHELIELIRRRPDIGVIIYRNLALGLGHKLRQSGGPSSGVRPDSPSS